MKFGVIIDVESSRAIRQAEVGAAKTMIERTEGLCRFFRDDEAPLGCRENSCWGELAEELGSNIRQVL